MMVQYPQNWVNLEDNTGDYVTGTSILTVNVLGSALFESELETATLRIYWVKPAPKIKSRKHRWG